MNVAARKNYHIAVSIVPKKSVLRGAATQATHIAYG